MSADGQLGSGAARDLYLTRDGAGVARALGIPVVRSPLIPYGTVIEDRTTGDLRLIVGTLRTFADTLADVRTDVLGVILDVFGTDHLTHNGGEIAGLARVRERHHAATFLAQLAGEAVASAV